MTQIPLVSICMITYNHESFIAEAIEGVLMQQTNFKIELIIGEDCSTDNTRKIIQEYITKYPEIIIPQFPEKNKGMMRNFREVMAAAQGKYIALCEGDDYWQNPYKLQKQVDFLEENEEYGMVYSKAQCFLQEKGEFGDIIGEERALKGHIFYGNPIPTLTTLFRRSLVEDYLGKSSSFPNKGWLMGDYPMWIYFSNKTKIKYMDEVTSVYRVLKNSASHSEDLGYSFRFVTSAFNIRMFFAKYFDVDLQIKKQIQYNYYWVYRLEASKINNTDFFDNAISFYQENGYVRQAFFSLLYRKLGRSKIMLNFIHLIEFVILRIGN